MAQLEKFGLPDVGEGLTEAEVLTWHVGPGDPVTVNQVIVEIETAKAAVELPSPFAGVVHELLVEPGSTVEVGTPIIVIDTEPGSPAGEPTGESVAESAPEAEERIPTLVGYGPRQGPVTRRRRRTAAESTPVAAATPAAPAAPATPAEVPEADTPQPSTAAALVPLAKPPVRKLARDHGIDLRTLAGSGPNGVITRDDVRAAGSGARPGPAPASATRERRVPIRGVRRATAEAMVQSAFTAPHVTEFLAVDVTPTMELRDRLRNSAEFAEVKLTPLAFVAKAVCLAVRRTPEINATWDSDAGEIVYKDYVHLGIAAATPRGLVVPKVFDADAMSLRELAEAIAALTGTARAGRSAPADLVGGTFTITNVGVFGVDTGTPIINPGEAAILAVGAVKPAPWVVDGELAVRTVCQLALSFDHRLVDGSQGSQFLADVGALLADPGLALTF